MIKIKVIYKPKEEPKSFMEIMAEAQREYNIHMNDAGMKMIQEAMKKEVMKHLEEKMNIERTKANYKLFNDKIQDQI